MTSESDECKCENFTCKSCYGLLAKFEGKWEGTGMAITYLPYFNKKEFAAKIAVDEKVIPFRLKVQSTKETFEFKKIEEMIPNRGRLISSNPLRGQKDINT